MRPAKGLRGACVRVTSIRLLEGDGTRVLARASIVIDEMIAIHGLAIMPGRPTGLHLAMPRHVHTDGSKRDVVHPINQETRQYIEECVFDAYRKGEVVKREPA